MSHEIELIDGRASFAYNRHNGNPWHRLGESMDGLQDSETMLEVARADYEVFLGDLYVEHDFNLLPAMDHKATMRVVDDVTQILGVVGKDYTIVQNREALNRALDIVGATKGDAVIDTCGVLFDGKRFFACLDLGTLAIDPMGIDDRITRYLGVFTSHDGTQALTYALTDLRWVCNNTVTAGIASAHRVFRARHTATVEQRMNEAQQVLGINANWTKEFSEMAERLLGEIGGQAQVESLINTVWPKGEDFTARQLKNWEERSEKIHEIYAGPTCSDGFGHSGWTAYNAIAEYVDHYRPRLSEERSALGAISDTSSGAKAKALAYNTLVGA